MQDKMETLLPSSEEKDREEEEHEREEGQANDGDEKTDREEEVEETPQAADIPDKDKKQTDVLNLNNEVVNMRKEVKRVRVLVIRKLTRQMAALKNKKGNEAAIEKNHRRADRLLGELHAMKVLIPDVVTKTALQKQLNFEEVCKNPKSSLSDRAIARIATHPQFHKKIEDIKAAVKAFKEERVTGWKQGKKKKVQEKSAKVKTPSPGKKEKPSEKKEEGVSEQLKEISDNKGAKSGDITDIVLKKIPESKSVEQASTKKSEEKDPVKNEPQRKAAGKKQNVSVHKKKEEEEDSELESSDEEKEYFDDSTEERFLKQSSQSEESEDDFFVGKVSKFKKKRKQKVVEGERIEQWQEGKGEPTDNGKTSDRVERELDELESRLKSKATSLKSVFCSSLSGSKQAAGRERGSDTFRGQRKGNGGSGFKREFSKESKFQKVSGEERNSGSKYVKPFPESRWQGTEEKSFASAGRGRGRGQGRGNGMRQNIPMGRGAISHQPPQQALHPSWEASKKRKEQQGQIMAFQGKKIKFDDD